MKLNEMKPKCCTHQEPQLPHYFESVRTSLKNRC